MAEKQVPLPLTGAEVREAILFRIEESLLKTCHLNESSAYTSFSGEITIKLKLSDFGREVPDNHVVTVQEGDLADAREVSADVTIAPAAPNTVRVETGQDVPVKTVEDGKQVVKKVKYQARRK